MSRKSIAVLLAACTALALLLPTRVARACGGFFCSQAAPVNQSAEQIIFSQNEDDTVTAVISIRYQGAAERFAWVLPISGVPDVGVSSDLAFQRLLAATSPSYQLTRRIEGTCRQEDYNGNAYAAGGTSAGGATSIGAGGTAGTSSGPVVNVVAQGSVGPYDFVAISVSEDAEDPASLALKWLADNQFDVSALGEDILASYLEQGLNLLAFRLTKGNQTGSIRPIRVTYPAKYPVIPIRPTAVAADDDMGVMVYMVAAAQAIPKNYKSLVLNEALINWFGFSSTYNAVITQAANEAGGQGFVSEFAGPSIGFNRTIWNEFDEQVWNSLQSQAAGFPLAADGGVAASADPWALLNDLIAQYSSWDGLRDAVVAGVTLPSDVTLDGLMATPWLYQDDARINIDVGKLLDGVQLNVIDPMIDTQKLITSRPYLTRMFTTMSADEMTVDPLFSINPDLSDISNVHTAEQVIECSSDVYSWEAPWRIELPQGGVVRGAGSGNVWPYAPGNDQMPANRKIVELTESGAGEVVTDNSQLIWRTLGVPSLVSNPAVNDGDDGATPIGGVDSMVPPATYDSTPRNQDGGCSLLGSRGSVSGALLTLLFGALGLAVLRRRA
jgi:hypothetical protein